MTTEPLLFWLFAIATLGSALWIVAFARDWISGVMGFVMLSIGLSGLDMLLGATFLGVSRIIIHAGAAIALLFSSVLIREADVRTPAHVSRLRVCLKTAGAAGLIVCGLLVLSMRPRWLASPSPESMAALGTPAEPPSIGVSLFTDHVLAVETLSLIVLAAGVIAVALARRRAPS